MSTVATFAALCLCVAAPLRAQVTVPESSPSVRVTAAPVAIRTGINATSSFVFTCAYIGGLKGIKYMAVARKCGDNEGVKLAHKKEVEIGTTIFSDMPTGGSFTADLDAEEPVATLTLPAAGVADACIYACHVRKGDNNFWGYLNVPVEQTKNSEVVDLIKSINARRAALAGRIQALQAAVSADVDECALDPAVCGPAGSCTNTVVPPYTCTCVAGYEFDGTTCVDTDECAADPAICGPGSCTNTVGSYVCTCDEGYTFDGATCVDIDECVVILDVCGNGMCINIEGGYMCACDDGYEAGGDPLTCLDVNECDTPDICGLPTEGTCVNLDGTYRCDCAVGFTLGEDGTCEAGVSAAVTLDIDVSDKDLSPGGEDFTDLANMLEPALLASIAAETPGVAGVIITGFASGSLKIEFNIIANVTENPNFVDNAGAALAEVASKGVEVEGRSLTVTEALVDVNECAETPGICGTGGDCTNQVGPSPSYTCTCFDGYENTDRFSACTDIDECATGDVCGANAQCANTIGSFTCTCDAGYAMDEAGACADIDECQDPAICGDNATCANTEGSFTCTCDEGFSMDGTGACVEDDEGSGAGPLISDDEDGIL